MQGRTTASLLISSKIYKKLLVFIVINIFITLIVSLKFLDFFSPLLFIVLFVLLSLPIAIFLFTPFHILNPLLIFSTYFYVLILSIFTVINLYEVNVLEKAIAFVFFSYLFYCLGFLIFINKKIYLNPLKNINFLLIKDKYPINIMKFLMYLFIFIALANYIVILYKTTNLNLVEYYLNLGYYGRNLKKIFGLTSIGYILLYPAIFMAIILYVKNKISKVQFYLLFVIYILIILSLAKITNFVLSIIIPLSFLYLLRREVYISKGKIILGVILFTVALILLLYRMSADIARVKGISLDNIVSRFADLETLISIYFLKSNLPNINIIIFIMENWEEEMNFLKGLSIINIFSAVLPSAIREDIVKNFSVSWIIKNEWFKDEPGGGIPPTIIGELYANFGILGMFFMFLLGALTAILYNWTFSKPTYIKVIIYHFFLWKFVFLMAKGEFSRLSDITLIISLVIFFVLKKIYNLRYTYDKNLPYNNCPSRIRR